jgi:hypothetical protein
MREPAKRARAAKGDDPLVTVRLPGYLWADVKALAKRRGINRSAALRSLVELGLRATVSEKAEPKPILARRG